jgi:serine protease Do
MAGQLLGLLLVAALAGCATSRRGMVKAGRMSFASMQRAVAQAAAYVEPGLAVVTVQNAASGASEQRVLGMVVRMGGESGGRMTGIIVSKEGHLLVPDVIKPDSDARIEVLVGESEYIAVPVKADENLGMSLLKIEGGDSFTPLDLGYGSDLVPGEWVVIVTPSDESRDFQKLVSTACCRGEVGGRYRKYDLGFVSRDIRGCPVVDLSGRVAALATGGGIPALSDLSDDLRAFLKKGIEGKAGENETSAGKKGWLGLMVDPVNKQYAQWNKLPLAGLWAVHVAEDGPAAKAGIKAGDLITGVNGQLLRYSGQRTKEFFAKSLHANPGESFTIEVIRNGREVKTSGTFVEQPEPVMLRAEDLGVTVAEIHSTEVFAENLFTKKGVMVRDVQKGSPAAVSGYMRVSLLMPKDVIVELAGHPTPDIKAFGDALESVRREKPAAVLVKYWRGPATGYAGLNLRIGAPQGEAKQ